MELRAELGAVVRLDHLDLERQLLHHELQERRGVVEPVVDPKHLDPGAVIDRGELAVLPTVPCIGAMNFT